MNSVIIIGNTANKPELNPRSENPVTAFTVAVNRKGKDNGADFLRCVAFGRLAETIAQYVEKGRKVAIRGRLQTGSYEKDGVRVNTVDIIVEDCEFLGSNPEQRSTDRSYHSYGGYSEEPQDYRRFEEPLF